jgi:hypothetical protein
MGRFEQSWEQSHGQKAKGAENQTEANSEA